MKKVKNGGYQHRYWLQQQGEIAQRQEWLMRQLLAEMENISASANTIRALTLIAQMLDYIAQSRQITQEMSDRIGEPSLSRLDEIIEKIKLLENSLEEIAKTS